MIIKLITKLVVDLTIRALQAWLQDRRLRELGWQRAQLELQREREKHAQKSQTIRDVIANLNASELRDAQYFPDGPDH